MVYRLSLILSLSFSLLTSCTIGIQQDMGQTPTEPTPTHSIVSGELTTENNTGKLSYEEREELNMVDDSLTVLLGQQESTCTDAFNSYVAKMIEERPDGYEGVITYYDLIRHPESGACILGYSANTDVMYNFYVMDIDNIRELTYFECSADYDVETDTLTPCNESGRLVTTKSEYDSYIADILALQ